MCYENEYILYGYLKRYFLKHLSILFIFMFLLPIDMTPFRHIYWYNIIQSHLFIWHYFVIFIGMTSFRRYDVTSSYLLIWNHIHFVIFIDMTSYLFRHIYWYDVISSYLLIWHYIYFVICIDMTSGVICPIYNITSFHEITSYY